MPVAYTASTAGPRVTDAINKEAEVESDEEAFEIADRIGYMDNEWVDGVWEHEIPFTTALDMTTDGRITDGHYVVAGYPRFETASRIGEAGRPRLFARCVSSSTAF